MTGLEVNSVTNSPFPVVHLRCARSCSYCSVGLQVTEANRPRIPLAQTMFQPLLDAKALLQSACPPPLLVLALSALESERRLIPLGVPLCVQALVPHPLRSPSWSAS